jgi:outer membrane protein insertion porin family
MKVGSFVLRRSFYGLLVLTTLLSSCSGLRYVPDDKVLYTGAEIKLRPTGKVTAKRALKELMDQNVSPKPNTSIFGMRPGLWFYYIAGDDKRRKGFRHFVKTKLGQVPIYMEDVDKDRTTLLLRGTLKNHGFFQAEVESREIVKNKKGKIIYTAHIHSPYRVNELTYPELDTLFSNIDSVKNESYLKKGQRYNLERLQAEQERIEEALENKGFYFFDDRYLIFEADSTVGDRNVDLLLTLEPGVPKKATRVYKIGQVTIFPNYSLSRDSVIRASDTLFINGYNYIDRLKMFKAKVITKVINLKPGNIYRREDREYTLSHLMSMGSFKFVDIQFEELENDSTTLNTNIFLTPYLKKSIRADLQATSKSNNFVGPGMTIKYTDRNVFKGSERFDVTANAGYEVQISRKVPQPLNAFELGMETSLSFPRFLTPFNIYYPTRKFLPTTDMKLGFQLQQRINFFRLNSFNLASGYTWRENTLKNHELFPVDINYMRVGDKSPEFEEVVSRNRFLAQSLENQFIMGARYAYTLNTQVNRERMEKFREQKFERSHFYFNGRIESAGNLVHLLMGGGFENEADTTDFNKIFGSAYSQFVRGEADFRYYFQVSKKNKIATRVAFGMGYAYGNSVTLPYIRQFAVGGSTSVRAFPARSLGPGTYDVRTEATGEERILFLDQRGDIKLESNAEFRFDIFNVLKGAVFADAGNIWLWRDDPDREGNGEQFKRSQFLKELAVGTGVGLRADFNFFVLRFDLAFPIRKPWLPEDQRWVFDQIDFGSSSWRSENLVLNIAIGYPF